MIGRLQRRRASRRREIAAGLARALAAQTAVGLAVDPEPKIGPDVEARLLACDETLLRARGALFAIRLMLRNAAADDDVVRETLDTPVYVRSAGGATVISTAPGA